MPNSSKVEFNRAPQQDTDAVIVEDNLFISAGFTQVPNAILRHPALSHGAKLTYAILLSYAQSETRSFPRQERIALDLGVDSRTVRRLLTELKETKLVRVERRGLGQTNIYYLGPMLRKLSGRAKQEAFHA